MDAVRRHFRPEFMNRIDEIVVFHRLRPCEQMAADRRHPDAAAAEALADRKITLTLDDRRAPGSRTAATTPSTVHAR